MALLAFSVLTLVISQNFLKGYKPLFLVFGKIKYKSIQNFCGVLLGVSWYMDTDMVSRSLRKLVEVRGRVCPNFWLKKMWSLCSESILSHHIIIIPFRSFSPPHWEVSRTRCLQHAHLSFLVPGKCLWPSQVLGTDWWTQSGMHRDSGGFVVHIRSRWSVTKAGKSQTFRGKGVNLDTKGTEKSEGHREVPLRITGSTGNLRIH